jgi:hypothetical protein
MRRLIATATGLLILISAAQGQPNGPQLIQQPSWGTKFFPDGVTHDFGNVPYGAQLTYKFKVFNPYNSQFIMEDARPSCGCVSVRKPVGATDPRDATELEVNLDTRKAGATGRPTVKTVTVSMVSVPDAQGRVFRTSCVLTVQCLIQSNIRFSNDKILFGVVNQGQTPQAVLDLEHFALPGWQITDVVEHNHPVDVKIQQIRPRMGGVAAYQVVATLKSTAPAGEIKYEVQLKTNDPATPVITVLMEGVIQAPLIASPNNVELGNVKVGEVVTARVILRGPQGVNFNVTKVDGLGSGFSMELPKKAMPGHLLKLEFVPGAEGKVTKTLTLTTDLPGNIKTTVVVEGTGIK